MHLANTTKIKYEVISWLAFFTVGEGDDQVTTAVNIERLRELVQGADKDFALLKLHEGGNA